MIKLQKKEKRYYEGKEIHLQCQGCGSEKEEYGYATMEIVSTDKYDQKSSISLCPECIEQLSLQFQILELTKQLRD
jgi:hypothetical protein